MRVGVGIAASMGGWLARHWGHGRPFSTALPTTLPVLALVGLHCSSLTELTFASQAHTHSLGSRPSTHHTPTLSTSILFPSSLLTQPLFHPHAHGDFPVDSDFP